MGFVLRHHVYGCVANHRVVLLDLLADRYFCAPPLAEAAIKDLIDKERSELADIEGLRPLLSSGLIVETIDPGFDLTAITLPKPRESVFDQKNVTRGFGNLAASVSVRFASSISMKMRPVHRVLEGLSTRKRSQVNWGREFSQDEISAMAGTFVASRRILSKQDKCLPWSVAMVNYLSRSRFFPDLVIGVKMDPFAAHAWVQHRGLVLSDTAEAALPYTPILTI